MKQMYASKHMTEPSVHSLLGHAADLTLFKLLCASDDLLQFGVHQLLFESRQLSLLRFFFFSSQVLVGQQLHSHPVLVGQQVLLNQRPKHILP